MGYYGASVYRGDYYGQGDYYRATAGDPGFFDFLGGIASKVLPVAAPIVGGLFGGPIGAALGGFAGGALGKVLGPGPPIPSPPALIPPVWAAASPGTGSTAAMIPGSPFAAQPRRSPPMPGGASITGVTIGGPSGLVMGKQLVGGVTPIGGGIGRHFHGKRPYYGPTHTVFRRMDSWQVKDSRRMNPLNPHALRKALRRAKSFTKVVSKAVRFTKPGHHVGGFKGIRGKGKK